MTHESRISRIRHTVQQHDSWVMLHDSWVMSLMNQSRVMSHITNEFVMWHDAFISDVTRSYVAWSGEELLALRHDSFVWLIDMIDSFVTRVGEKFVVLWHDSFICDMTQSYVTCLIHVCHASCICDMPHSYVTCLIHVWHASFACDMPHSYVTRHLRSKKIRK